MIALLFLAALAVYARAEMKYHPQAVLNYLEMEDREMARKVRSIVNARGLPSGKPSFSPSSHPPKDLPPGVVSYHIFYWIYSTVTLYMGHGLKKKVRSKEVFFWL